MYRLLPILLMVTMVTGAPSAHDISKRESGQLEITSVLNVCPSPCHIQTTLTITGVTEPLNTYMNCVDREDGNVKSMQKQYIEAGQTIYEIIWVPPAHVRGFYECMAFIETYNSNEILDAATFRMDLAECDGTVCHDPHLRTLDGRPYGFHGICWFTLIKDCSGGNPMFEITAKFLPRDDVIDELKTKTVAINVTVADERFSVNEKNEITVNDQPYGVVQPKYMEIEAGNGTVAIKFEMNGTNFTIHWTGKQHIFYAGVRGTTYHGKLCGLLGNRDGNPLNDFQKPDGIVVKDIVEFGESWRVPGVRCD